MNVTPASIVVNPQTLLLDTFVPGFSLVSTALQKYFHIDTSIYIPILLVFGFIVFVFRYVNEFLWETVQEHLVCSVDIKENDEVFNFFMTWVATQKFAHNSRRFVANTNLNSRQFYSYSDSDDDDDENQVNAKKDKQLHYTPSTGKHHFFYRRHLCFFMRVQNKQTTYGTDRENISVSCYGRDASVLKTLLEECRSRYVKADANKTTIYRGSVRGLDPTWTRSMARISRPFSTVVLDEQVKRLLVEDMSDYLHPATKRWYANRGIPYRRGYLLHGPPGTGKSSLSFAIAGYFKLSIYILSLNSSAMNEETMGNLFAELPGQCVVLLEDIDSAGLTHTRDTESSTTVCEAATAPHVLPGTGAEPGDSPPPPAPAPGSGRMSLSALLNVIDGVASQEGRILIMTTNHIDNLDAALVRPGRVDMKIRFDLASKAMTTTIFKDIFVPISADLPKPEKTRDCPSLAEKLEQIDQEATTARLEKRRLLEEQRITILAERFAELLPEDMYSPAEIQGYLLRHKLDPNRAVDGAAAWVRAMTEKKNKGKENPQAR